MPEVRCLQGQAHAFTRYVPEVPPTRDVLMQEGGMRGKYSRHTLKCLYGTYHIYRSQPVDYIRDGSPVNTNPHNKDMQRIDYAIARYQNETRRLYEASIASLPATERMPNYPDF